MGPVVVVTVVNSLRRANRGSDQELKRDCILEIQQLATISETNKSRIAAVGGIKLICSAMGDHIGNVQIQQCGCGALMHLARNHEGNQSKIASAGGINAIVAAMNSQTTNTEIQQFGCGALMHLAINTNQRAQIEIGRAHV